MLLLVYMPAAFIGRLLVRTEVRTVQHCAELLYMQQLAVVTGA